MTGEFRLAQNDLDQIEELEKHGYFIDGNDLAKLVAVKARLYREMRLNGDQQRDLAQTIETVLRRATIYG